MRTFLLMLLCAATAFAEPPKITKVEISPPADFQDKLALRAGDVLPLNGGEDSIWSVTGLNANYFLWQKAGIIIFNVPADTPKGTQYILSCSAKGEISNVLVTVTNEKLPDPKKPDIKPVVPPAPNPTPPPDALVEKFKAAYTADKSVAEALKPKAIIQMIALYSLAQDECDKPENTTFDQLRGTISSASAGLMSSFLKDNNLPATDTAAKAVLKPVRDIIANELLATFPDDVDLDKDARAKAKAMYKRIHDCLALLGK